MNDDLEFRTDDELREIYAAAVDRLENDPEGNNRVDAQLAQYAAWVLAKRGIDV